VSPIVLLPLAAAASAAPDAVQAVHNFSACLVRKAPADAYGLLAIDVPGPVYMAKLQSAVKSHRCLKKGASLRADGLLLAGTLAEALLETKFQPSIPPEQLGPDPQRALPAAQNERDAFGQCTVLRAPKAITSLFATAPATDRETRAFEALKPTMSSCLKRNQKLNDNHPALRSILALAAWRIVSAPRRAGR
jgi:hypothetical protein